MLRKKSADNISNKHSLRTGWTDRPELTCLHGKMQIFLERHVSAGQLKCRILDLQDLIIEMSLSADIQRMFIVIDGLDKCTLEQPDHLEAITDIPHRARKVKMLITSRSELRIKNALRGYSTLTVDNVTLNATLPAVIDRELERSDLVANMRQQDLDEFKQLFLVISKRTYVMPCFDPSHILEINAHYQYYKIFY